MKKICVISLGGSVIIPNRINTDFLEEFAKVIRSHYKDFKFVVVCGGGSIARAYIAALKKENKNSYELSQAGIRSTRMNALFMMQFFGKGQANDSLPLNMRDVENALSKNNIVFCGALRWSPESTSDSTAAKLANELKTEFINITNVNGLFTSDPDKNSKANLIKNISWKEFQKKANKTKFHAGQHFVLDQNASKIIKDNKIKTYIIGSNTKNLSSLLDGKKFIGTTIND